MLSALLLAYLIPTALVVAGVAMDLPDELAGLGRRDQVLVVAMLSLLVIVWPVALVYAAARKERP